MKLEEIKACLEGEGWPVELLSDATLRSGFKGSARSFLLFVHIEATYVTFAVIPFVRLPPEAEAADEVARQLLRLNREINMAKFSVDEDGDVVLSVEYRLEDLDPSEVRDAVDVLSLYTEKYHAEVKQLAAL